MSGPCQLINLMMPVLSFGVKSCAKKKPQGLRKSSLSKIDENTWRPTR